MLKPLGVSVFVNRLMQLGEVHLVKQSLDWSASDDVDDVLQGLEDLNEQAITQYSEVTSRVPALGAL